MMPYWTQATLACKCGHPAHEGRRCQSRPGCPCDQHETSTAQPLSDDGHRYYYGVKR